MKVNPSFNSVIFASIMNTFNRTVFEKVYATLPPISPIEKAVVFTWASTDMKRFSLSSATVFYLHTMVLFGDAFFA